MSSERIQELERRIAAVRDRWPAHSVSPGLFQQLEDLEEEPQREIEKVREGKSHARAGHRQQKDD